MIKDSRRSFIKKLASGAAVGAYAFSSVARAALPKASENNSRRLRDKNMKIGIIGAENSHTILFGKLFNVENKFPGIKVEYVWGETEDLALKAMKEGHIPNQVKDPNEMLGKIDALIVDHRHPKYHLDAATPFVKAGIPTFIDKPFCYRAAEGKKFLDMAAKLGTPVTSFSTIADCDGTFDMKKQVESAGEISNVVAHGPVDLDSPYGGIFFYGVHMVQPLMFIFGEDIKKVMVVRDKEKGSASLAFGNGMLATLVFNTLHYGWENFIETKKGISELKSRVQETDPPRYYRDMVEMFRTGKEPRSHQSILNCVSVLEALEKSVNSGHWEDVIYV